MKNCIIILFLSIVGYLQGQQLPVLSSYIYNPYLYNPARTGDSEMGSININFKRQWTSMPYAPITGILSAEMKIKDLDMGLGGLIYSDNTHIINRIGGLASYAYHIPLSKSYPHHISIGLAMGFIHQNFDFDQATVENPNDAQLLASNASGTAFDFSAGLNYRWKDLNFGFSMMQGIGNGIKFLSSFGQEVQYVNARHFILNGSYDFYAGKEKEFLIRPVALMRIVPNLPVQGEFSVVSNWKRLIWVSLGYRSSNWKSFTSALVSSVGVELKQRIFLSYNFEFTPSAQQLNSLGTQHEFMISYRLGKDKQKEKEMIEMKSVLDKLQQNDKAIIEKLEKTEKGVRELNQKLSETNANFKSEIQRVDEKLKALEEEDQKLQKTDEELKNRINELQEMNNAQQTAINQHAKAIEELREAIKKQPMKYKKMGDVMFNIGASELSATEKSKLDAIKKLLDANPTHTVYLYGNASTDGDQTRNMELSSKRCISVRKYLVSLGMNGEKIIALPMGQENTSSGTAQVNPIDRRVDIMISEK